MTWLALGKELYMEQRMVVTVERIGAQLRKHGACSTPQNPIRRTGSQRITREQRRGVVDWTMEILERL
eukprot:CAMPEP_0172445660 /NCGR_PEP_ID=MMETSP1065-20121228/5456_1 /TAXON_ID=265537 /ORGANISM="Amphiprora paludosa, Strain CCMP125" /LENGTH=67 /DNA_ID=CAMNT_0013196577 /DNA_START=369 /DNA_END=572 /DNA_ORIENTATION=+